MLFFLSFWVQPSKKQHFFLNVLPVKHHFTMPLASDWHASDTVLLSDLMPMMW
jgi:hypothetical protein